MGGHRKRVLAEHREFIHEQIKQTSHLTLHGLKDLLAERGVIVSHQAVWRFLKDEGLRFKKTLFALEQTQAGVARQRRRWKSWQGRIDPGQLGFLQMYCAAIGAPIRQHFAASAVQFSCPGSEHCFGIGHSCLHSGCIEPPV